jgi:hypothetical protein
LFAIQRFLIFLRERRVSTLDSPFQLGKLVTKPGALAVGTLECGLKPGFLNFEVLGSCMGATINLDDGDAQISFCLARALGFAPQTVELEFASTKHP